MSILFALALAAAPIPSLEEAEAMIAERDAELFYEAFEGCDTEKLRTLFDDSYRMLHDIDGLIANSGDDFVGRIAEGCETKDPSVYANRRQHVEGSRQVQMLGDWGAMEEGLHIFLESQNGGPFEKVGRARYIHIWRWNGEAFVLEETLSVDHGPY